MNMNNLLTVLGWTLFVLMLIANYFEFAKKNDPEIADKMKHVGLFAEWAVSLQDTLDKSNQDKQTSAVNEVMEQAKQSKINITPAMAKGAVEKAVANRKKPKTDNEVQSLLDDLEVK